jgi:aspergillopepsin I
VASSSNPPIYELIHTHLLRWVFSTSLPLAQQKGHTLFNSSKSKNWKALTGYTWNITYGDKSSASGTVGTDVVTVGGTSVSGQAVEIATQASSQLVADTANNGLLGLAFSSLNTGEIPSRLSVA